MGIGGKPRSGGGLGDALVEGLQDSNLVSRQAGMLGHKGGGLLGPRLAGAPQADLGHRAGRQGYEGQLGSLGRVGRSVRMPCFRPCGGPHLRVATSKTRQRAVGLAEGAGRSCPWGGSSWRGMGLAVVAADVGCSCGVEMEGMVGPLMYAGGGGRRKVVGMKEPMNWVT